MQTFNPTVIEAAIRGTLIKAVSAAGAGAYLKTFAEYISSNKRSERHAWIGPPPRMERVGKDRNTVYTPMSDAAYELENEVYKAGVVVNLEDIEDDQLGAIMTRVRQLGAVAAHHPDRLVTEALVAGVTNLCWDGDPFYSTTHPARGDAAQWSNIHTGTGDSTAQVADDFAEALALMQGLLAENGEPYHQAQISKIAIMAGPRMRKPMMEAFGAREISATTNVQIDGLDLKVMINPRITTLDWHLCNVGGPVKPVIFQDRVALQLRSLEAESENGQEQDQYKYSVRWRGVAGYANPQDAVFVNNT